jgi:hypothetical protein
MRTKAELEKDNARLRKRVNRLVGRIAEAEAWGSTHTERAACPWCLELLDNGSMLVSHTKSCPAFSGTGRVR